VIDLYSIFENGVQPSDLFLGFASTLSGQFLLLKAPERGLFAFSTLCVSLLNLLPLLAPGFQLQLRLELYLCLRLSPQDARGL
jgi:hypothetical protein